MTTVEKKFAELDDHIQKRIVMTTIKKLKIESIKRVEDLILGCFLVTNPMTKVEFKNDQPFLFQFDKSSQQLFHHLLIRYIPELANTKYSGEIPGE